MPDTRCDYACQTLDTTEDSAGWLEIFVSFDSSFAALYATLKGTYGAQSYDILAQFSSSANCA